MKTIYLLKIRSEKEALRIVSSSARARSTLISGTTVSSSASTASWKIALTIYGHMPSLKNNRRMFKSRKTGKIFPAKSDEATRYMQDFVSQVPPDVRNLRIGSARTPLRLVCTVFYRSRRSDLCTAILVDSMQTAGIISNDRYIREIHAYGEVDAKNPRVELILEEI